MGQYSEVFCRVYNEFGWNYYPEAFGQQLLQWLEENNISVKASLDLACGTGILCGILAGAGIQAAGADLSEGMITVARENHPHIPFTVADMTQYRPEASFDLVTCTGDSLNHLMTLSQLEQVFRNVYHCLNPDGYFVFDLLNEKEVSTDEPFDFPFSDTITARFQMLRRPDGVINLKTRIFEQGEFRFEENIYETLHDPEIVCNLLQCIGFREVVCRDRLLPSANKSTTWYILARK